MILVDSSVWIDYFRGAATQQTSKLDALLGVELLAIGDLILIEVLQGFSSDRDFERARRLLETLVPIEIGGQDIALRAARNHRALRKIGLAPGGTIDTLIATRCIASGHTLLHSDRDFEPFEKHLGLRSVL
ncbi:MAG: PIN domain nuclease [Burkholderiaceae bacterium]|nr:PIN domain nuclease [Burkholderiaceae bacterium]